MNYAPKTIYLDDRAREYPLTKTIRKRFPTVPVQIVKDSKSFIKEFNKRKNAISEGKRSLFLTINKGKFIKKCPGTKQYLCCGYQILHQASQCTLDCSYCILQSYFNNPLITIFTNLDDLFHALDKTLDKNKKR
ncbi:MAG: DNA photolyase, partial [Candidatus Omnitrophica bacterium]|nr:DNA photolyase [Candidatus Omnitrophota bacterium]